MNNVGKADRIVRYILGIALIAAGVVLQITTAGFWWLALVGAVLLVTAAIRTCPIQMGLRLNSNKT